MSASQNKKKTLSLGLALIPVISMLLLLIIGYGIMGLRIYFDCSLLFNQRGLRLYRYIVGSAGTVGVALMGLPPGWTCRLQQQLAPLFLALISATKSHRCPTRLTLPRLSQTLLCLSIFSIYFGRPCQVSCLPPWFILSPDTVICWARWLRRSALRTSSTRWSRYTILILFLFCRR